MNKEQSDWIKYKMYFMNKCKQTMDPDFEVDNNSPVFIVNSFQECPRTAWLLWPHSDVIAACSVDSSGNSVKSFPSGFWMCRSIIPDYCPAQLPIHRNCLKLHIHKIILFEHIFSILNIKIVLAREIMQRVSRIKMWNVHGRHGVVAILFWCRLL